MKSAADELTEEAETRRDWALEDFITQIAIHWPRKTECAFESAQTSALKIFKNAFKREKEVILYHCWIKRFPF